MFLATTGSAHLILLAGLEWFEASNILQDEHYFTAETKDRALSTFFMRGGVWTSNQMEKHRYVLAK